MRPDAGAGSGRTVVLLDERLDVGHFVDYAPALAREIIRRGDRAVILVSTPPTDLTLLEGIDWEALPEVPLDRMGALRAYEEIAPLVHRACRRWDADLLCALALDRQFPVAGSLRRAAPRSTFVLHTGLCTRYRRSLRAGGRMKFIGERQVRALGRGRSRILVHTDAHAAALTEQVGGVTPVVAAWPLLPFPPGDDPVVPGRLYLPGAPRPDKGAQFAVEALATSARPVSIELGPAESGPYEAPPMTGSNPVLQAPAPPSRAEMGRSYRRAQLVLVPHMPGFGGAVSAVLNEAIALGKPVVTSDRLAHQVPPDYRGAVVFPAGDAEAFRRAVDDALDRIDELTAVAETEGPACFAHQSVAAYIDVLTDAPRRSGAR